MVGKYKHLENGDVVEAIQYTKSNLRDIEKWGGDYVSPHDSLNIIMVKTQNGTLLAFIDDYICKDSVYNTYPVMRHKFETQYIPLGDEPKI
jgi:hypothetical protein